MANLINLNAETGANYIGDDAQPSLTITNSSTGAGIETDRLSVISSATIAGNASANPVATFTRTTLSGPTSAHQAFLSSIASGPVFDLKGQAFVSAVSIVFAASANWAGMGAIPVKRSDGTIAFIPVLPPAVVTAAVFS